MPPVDAPRGETIEFFGPGRELLGCFTDALTPEARDIAVIVAQPIGHEYVRCHRALRRLALYLASRGFPVFRFDWFGTGDSAGEFGEGSMDRWIDDLGDAVAETERNARTARTAIIGLRHGASIAAMASEIIGPPDMLVLWDPVIRGPAGLEPMRADHARHEHERGLPPGATRRADGAEDIFGFVYSPAMIRELEAIDLNSIRRAPARATLVVDQDEASPARALAEHLASLGQCEHAHEPRSPIWMAEPHTGLVPREAIERIGAWLSSEADRAEGAHA